MTKNFYFLCFFIISFLCSNYIFTQNIKIPLIELAQSNIKETPFLIQIKYEDNKSIKIIEEDGMLDFLTNYNDDYNIFDFQDIKEKTSFKTHISDENNNKYKVECHLDKQLGKKLNLLCKLKELMVKGVHNITLSETSILYKRHEISFFFDHFLVEQYEESFIFSIEQILNKGKPISQENKDISLYILERDDKDIMKIGEKGVLSFITDYNDADNGIFNISDIETKTVFKSKIISDDKNEYDVNCRLWKPKNENITIRCRLDEYLFPSKQRIRLNASYINYDDYKISIFQDNFIEVEQVDSTIPFLYSEQQIIVINIENVNSYDYVNVGINGVIYFTTNHTDNLNIFDPLDIEDKTNFDTVISENQNKHNASCRLWKPLNEKMRGFCKLNEILSKTKQTVYLSFAESFFTYNGYIIKVICSNYLSTIQLNKQLPFIYSDKQVINIEERRQYYNFTFKIGLYNNEKLLLYGPNYVYISLDECEIKGRDITCIVSKQKLEEISVLENQKLSLSYYDYNNPPTKFVFNSVLEMVVNFTNNEIEKELIYVNIEKLNYRSTGIYGYVSYNTNVTSISNFNALYIKSEVYERKYGSYRDISCFFKKTEDYPLIMFCQASFEGEQYLTSLKRGKLLEDIHFKYNFEVLPYNGETYKVVNTQLIYDVLLFPNTLNYYSKDEYTVDYYVNGDGRDIKLQILSFSSYLNCDSSYDYSTRTTSIRCTIPKSYFGKSSGFYYTYIIQSEMTNILYEISPMHVLIPKDNEILYTITKKDNNKDILKIGNNGTIVFFVDSNDKKNLEKEEILFDSKIHDDKYNEYKVNCKLWIPNEKKQIIMCTLHENLKYDFQYIILNEVSFYSNYYTITIRQEDYIRIEQLNYTIPFLYSNNQKIDIVGYALSYNLIFNIESYHNELLYIYGNSNNYAIIDTCIENDKKLICEMQKEKLEEISGYNNEHFKIGAMDDNIGIIELEYISDIQINYYIFEKKDIYVSLINLINSNPEVGVPFGFETNISDIPNLNTDIFENFYFKKIKGNNLKLLTIYQSEEDFQYENLKNGSILENIHYKYNFIIQPIKDFEKVSIKGKGTDIKLVYPEILNFTLDDKLIIRYIMTDSSLAQNIKLNPDSSDLECENLYKMKKCIVPFIHFIGKKTGNYSTYHSDYLDIPSLNYEISPINVVLPTENIIEIYVNDKDNQQSINIGQNNMLYFVTNYSDNMNIFNADDIEKKTSFEAKITDKSKKNYNITCRLWKPTDENIRILCKLNENLNQQQFIKLNSVLFLYDKYRIAIVSLMNYNLEVTKFNSSIPFLYYDKQTINIENEKDFYYIKFKIEEYNNELLILSTKQEYNRIILDECKNEGKYLKCKIKKEKIEEILGFSGEKLKCSYFDDNLGILYELSNIMDITINSNNINKENIYIKITNLLESTIDKNNFIGYETNITSISNIITYPFKLSFGDNMECSCLMKKTSEKPLFLICNMDQKGNFSLVEIKKEIKLENINIKYNIFIQPSKNDDSFEVDGNGNSILLTYPTILNFAKQNYYIIQFYSNNGENSRDIKLNPDANGLSCETINNIKKCLVEKNHFNGKQTGYYPVYYKNNKNTNSIFYEISPIEVILPTSNVLSIKLTNLENEIGIYQNGVIVLETNYNGGLLNLPNLEEISKFKGTFSDDNKSYRADCRLWKPFIQSLRIICKFSERLNTNYIKFDEDNLLFNDYTILFLKEENIYIKLIDSNYSLLYNDQQIININNNDNYNISFEKEIYNNETLILYREGLKNIILNCNEESDRVICNIKKNHLLEILSYHLEKFYLYQLTDSNGMLKFDNVFDIIIDYNNYEQEDIYLDITKLLTPETEKNNFIVYETNVTSISPITTNYFNINSNRNSNLNCLLKKNNNKDALLLLCDAKSSGEFSLGNINDMNLDKISILYNFKIIEAQNYETCVISSIVGSKLRFVYPNELDFNVEQSYIIKYQVDDPTKISKIKLNNDSLLELECIDKIGIKECTVPITHFNKPGDYYTYYTDSLGSQMIAYEVSTIKVILNNEIHQEKEENYAGVIAGSIIGGLILIALIGFFVMRYLKKKKAEINSVSGNEISVPLELKNESTT